MRWPRRESPLTGVNKEGRKGDENVAKKFAWIQNIIENQENINNPDEFLENVRIDLFPDEVYIFTPRGEIKSLPRGATPVDFAYLIHSEVGNQCVGAKVNGRMVPLKTELQTGNIVEIITSKNQPSQQGLVEFCQNGEGPFPYTAMDKNPGKGEKPDPWT